MPENESNPQHLENLLRGFSSLAVGADQATFLAGTQAQVMSLSIGTPKDQETAALRAVNTLFLSGLILDLMAAFLSYLTSRWLRRLSKTEMNELEKAFNDHQGFLAQKNLDLEEKGNDGRAPINNMEYLGAPAQSASNYSPPTHKLGWNDKLVEVCFAISLVISMPLLAFGSLCMVVGLIVYTWSQHPTVVASVVTGIFTVNVPFLAGVILISRKPSRRRAIIHRLSTMQGSW
ncbi:hypothetical protein HWV62_7593 [Athelia sp. TMB]|nr:hypothetical protein HWV62_7593 [Athelia sp. TMB]